MKAHLREFLYIALLAGLAIIACQPTVAQPETLIQTPALLSSKPAEAAPSETPAPDTTEAHGNPLLTEEFNEDSPFCLAEPSTSVFKWACSSNELIISQSENRRKVDIFLFREVPIQSSSFSLEVDAESAASQGVKSDQNNYGFYFVDESGQFHALRLTAQYFDFETWSMNGELKIEEKSTLAFSPLIKSSGQNNTLSLDCSSSGCDFFANGGLAGRIPAGINGKVKAIGLFAASGWNRQFGQLKFKNLQVYALPNQNIDIQPYQVNDALTSNNTTFTGTGLSGAFNKYEVDGFHFSPVIPYGYYSVKGGPALGDISVGVTVKMEVKPGISGSRYAGLVCRSSQEGMVMAVIRADGTYTIYRDTPKRPFAVLAQKASGAILPGLDKNKLRLDCIGDQINFYINDTQVESLTDTRYGLRFGRAGLFTKGGGNPDPDAVVFRDFSISEVR